MLPFVLAHPAILEDRARIIVVASVGRDWILEQERGLVSLEHVDENVMGAFSL